VILHTLAHCGSYAFQQPIEVNFDQLPEVVAVVGDNGAGKTTFLDLCVVWCFGFMPFRPGPLYDNFVSKGYVKSHWTHNRREYLSTILVDPDLKKTEMTLHDFLTGECLAGPLQTDYLRTITQITGFDAELCLCTDYAIQTSAASTETSQSFLRADRATKRTILAGLLGLGRYSVWEQAAKEQIARLELTLKELRGRLGFFQEVAAREAPAAAAIDRYVEDMVVKRLTLNTLTAELNAIAAELLTQEDRYQERQRLVTRENDLQRDMREYRNRLWQGQQDKAKQENILKQKSLIRDAQEELPHVTARIQELEQQLLALDEERMTASQRNAERHVAQERATRATESLKVSLQVVKELSTVPCKGEGLYALCPYLQRAYEAKSGIEKLEYERQIAQVLPEAVDTAMFYTRLSTLKKELGVARGRIVELQGLIALKSHIEAAQERLWTVSGDLEATEKKILDLERELLETRELLLKMVDLNGDVEARRFELQPLLGKAANELSDCERALGEAEGHLKDAQAAKGVVTEFQRDIGEIEATISEWQIVARGLSPTGIPALRVDQALPAISVLATDILETSFKESRYSVELISQKLDAKGKKALETLEVVIRRDGDVLPAKKLCGGESILVSESLALGIAMYRGPVGGMLLRDEIAASLDQKRARVYTEMLRAAIRQSGQRLALFITHEQACVEAADARLLVANGRIEIE